MLQERRYEKLAGRLDARDPRTFSPVSRGLGQVLVDVSELEDINARLQRAERRVMGQLENESLASDKQLRYLELLLATLRNDVNNGN